MHWNEVTALFGGTFDPPHLGHREAVRGLFELPGVRRVQVIPSADPPHKTGITPAEHRVAMTRLCFSSTPLSAYPAEVRVDLREIERAARYPNIRSYSFDTLLEARSEFGSIAFVIGTDQFKDLPHWYRFPEILGLSHWIVLDRKTDEQTEASHELLQRTLREFTSSGLLRPASQSAEHMNSPSSLLGGQASWAIRDSKTVLQVIPTEAPALSSSAIRQSLGRTGQAPEGSLLAEVEAYLKQNRLYGTRV